MIKFPLTQKEQPCHRNKQQSLIVRVLWSLSSWFKKFLQLPFVSIYVKILAVVDVVCTKSVIAALGWPQVCTANVPGSREEHREISATSRGGINATSQWCFPAPWECEVLSPPQRDSQAQAGWCCYSLLTDFILFLKLFEEKIGERERILREAVSVFQSLMDRERRCYSENWDGNKRRFPFIFDQPIIKFALV